MYNKRSYWCPGNHKVYGMIINTQNAKDRKNVEVKENFQLIIYFKSGECVVYDVREDIDTIEDFKVLKTEPHLVENVQVDENRTCVYWNYRVDLPSDTLLEYGIRIQDGKNA